MARPTLTAIVTAHKGSPFVMMQNLADQSVKPAQVLVATSFYPTPWVVPSLPFPFTIVQREIDDRDYGYRKRNMLLTLAESDYVGFFAHDDSYENDYIERMMDAAELMQADVVYCDWTNTGGTNFPNCKFLGENSTLGNFVTRRSILQEIGGFPPRGAYHNDGFRDIRLIEELRKREGIRIAKVAVTLYHHNKPYMEGVEATSWGEPLIKRTDDK